MPAEMKAMVEAFANGDEQTARELHDRLNPLMTGLFKAPNPTLVKEALRLVGRPVGGLRLPLVHASDAESAEIASILSTVGSL